MAQGYANYPKLSFGKPKPKAQPQQSGGLHIYSDPEIRALAQGIVSRMPTPLTPQDINARVHALPAAQSNAQIQSTAMGMLDPAVQQLTSNVQGQTKAGLGAIRGYTDSLASYFRNQAPQQVTGAYAPAIAGTAATNAALADRLSGAGNQASDDLASRLASIGNPNAVDPAVEAIRHNAAGAGNASYATGSAALEALLANQASAQSYVGKMPGITRLGGLQQTGQYEQSQGRALTDQVGQLTAQLPSIVQALRNQSDTRANNRASARRDYIGLNDTRSTNRANAAWDVQSTLRGQNTPREIANANMQTDELNAATDQYVADVKSKDAQAKARAAAAAAAAKANAPRIVGSSKTGYYAFNPVTRERTLVVPPGPATAAAPKIVGSSKSGYYAYDPATRTRTLVVPPVKDTGPSSKPHVNTTLSAANGYLTDTSGAPIMRDGKQVPYKPAGKTAAKGGLSTSKYADLKLKAQKAADLFYWGDAKKGISALDYGQALARLTSGYSLTRADAETILNDFYAPGEAGRPETRKTAKSKGPLGVTTSAMAN